MKKVLACFLCIVLMASLITVPAYANDITATVTGTKTDKEATFVVDVFNSAAIEKNVKVYIANYNKEGALINAVSYNETVLPKVSTPLTYKADITQGEAKIFVWESGLRPASPTFSSDFCEDMGAENGTKIPVTGADVWASYTPEAANGAAGVVDGNFETKWSVSGTSDENPESLTMYLGGDYIVSRVGVAFGEGNLREYVFSVSVSSDGENFSEVAAKSVSEKTKGLQQIEVVPTSARYVRLNVFGRTDGGNWVQVTEFYAYGAPDSYGKALMENAEDNLSSWQVSAMTEMTYTDYRPMLGTALYAENNGDGLLLFDNVGRDKDIMNDKLEIASLTASQTPEAANAPENVLDGKLNTIWTAKNVTNWTPATLTVDLGKVQNISSAGIGFDLGAERLYTFEIAVANTDSTWYYKTVVSRTTSAATDAVQYFDLDNVEGRYVRFRFYKRADANDNGWLRVSEIELYGSDEPIVGAGGILAQKKLTLPADRGDFEVSFDLTIPSQIEGEESSAYYSGVSITDDYITGGADLGHYAAVQLRFDNSGDKVSVKHMTSNYFNEGGLVNLFANTFNKDEPINFRLLVSPDNRTVYVTVADSENSETQLLHFSYADNELTRNTSWTWLEANTLVFNTGAGAKNAMLINNLALHQVDRKSGELPGAEPTNGIIRLEATRLSSYPTSSGDYYGRYIYHNGADKMLGVAADKNPAITRFVERRGLIGTGVSLEAVTMPGYYIVAAMGDAFYLKKYENTGEFLANATFYKEEAENVGYYTGATYTYRTYVDGLASGTTNKEQKYFYDTDNNHKNGDLKPWKMWEKAQATFYLRSEGTEYVSDNFYGSSIGSQWWTNYPWKSNNPTNDSYNHSGLITKNNVIVENGELLLKATKASGWPTNSSGDTGIQYDKWGKSWERWKGYVGVVSIQNKVYNKQCYIEGSFKQPDSPVGYWNAFWLTGRDSWPPEIDIFETLSKSYGHYAWHTAIHGQNDQNNLFGKQTSGTNIATGYHTFALDWGYDYVKFYVDGKLFQRGQNHQTINFQKNMRLILNTGLGGWEAEPDDSMVWDDGLRCRYIRSFQY